MHRRYVAARVVEVPRVDLQLEGTGNRGYLVGTPPAIPAMKTRREMLETDIELPSFGRRTRVTRPQAAPQPPTPASGAIVVGSQEPMLPEMVYDTYVVKKGDSLWTIAAKPEIYGRATAWRSIYDANRDLLTNPNELQAGMELRIPRKAPAGEDATVFGK